MNKVDQLGLQLQKFGANIKGVAELTLKTAQHVAILFAALKVLKDKGYLTDEEIQAELQPKEETIV